MIFPVTIHVPGLRVIGQAGTQRFVDYPFLQNRIEDRKADLDSPEEVTVHPIRTGKVNRIGADEMEHTVVFQKATDD